MNMLAIDTETGGLVPGYHALLQLAAVPSWDAEPFNIYIWPSGFEVDPDSLPVSNYSPQEWERRSAVSLPVALEAFWDWLKNAPVPIRDVVLLAHNAGFDRAFIEAAYVHVNRRCPLGHRWRCSQAALAFCMDAGLVEAGSPSLNALAGLCGLGRAGQAHDALEDARICMAGYHWLIGLPAAARDVAVAQATTPGPN